MDGFILCRGVVCACPAMFNLTLSVLVLCLSGSLAGSLYMVVQKPVISYSDTNIFPFLNLTALRFGRNNDVYYSSLHLDVAVAMDNNFTLEVVFYEAVNHQYRRSFIEMQFKFCNFLFKDPIFGAALRKQTTIESCPVPKGTYHFYNMTASSDHLPPMPFSRGRIGTIWFYKKKVVVKGYADLEMKRRKN